MRGASALQEMLGRIEAPNLRALVVWEPVLASDLWPPTSYVLSRLDDPRAEQFWDESRSLSASLVRSPENSWLAPEGETVSPDSIVWDFVMVFPPGRTWGSHGPPTSPCSPVVACVEEIERAVLARAK